MKTIPTWVAGISILLAIILSIATTAWLLPMTFETQQNHRVDIDDLKANILEMKADRQEAIRAIVEQYRLDMSHLDARITNVQTNVKEVQTDVKQILANQDGGGGK